MQAMIRVQVMCGLLLCGSASLYADFQFDSSTKMTGGSLLRMMQNVPFTGKARASVIATILVKGNRMVSSRPEASEIIDLGNETITAVNFTQRTYSVMTFAEMKQAMEDMQKRMTRNGSTQPELEWKFSMRDTGETRQIGGYIAKETIIDLEA